MPGVRARCVRLDLADARGESTANSATHRYGRGLEMAWRDYAISEMPSRVPFRGKTRLPLSSALTLCTHFRNVCRMFIQGGCQRSGNPVPFFACFGRRCRQIPTVEKKQALIADVLPTHSPELFRAAVRRAAEFLRAGEAVALPTETVYGLAANALDAQAVERIFQIKGRPAHNPIIVHVASIGMAKRCVANWPALAGSLATAFWPGPLTLVLPRAKEIPGIITAGGPTVGVRWPSHPFIQAVINECGFPLAAPSANPSNRVSPTNAGHVRKSLGDKLRLIVDGGQAQIGIESTVLDISGSPSRLLRPGMIHEQALLAVTGELAVGASESPEVLKSPGLLRKHYSPKAKLVVWSWGDEAELEVRSSKAEVRSAEDSCDCPHADSLGRGVWPGIGDSPRCGGLCACDLRRAA